MARKKRELLVVDIEATCWESSENQGESEIIEIGITPIELPERVLGSPRSLIVRPRNTRISEFCTKLTTLTQAYVDEVGMDIEQAFRLLQAAYKSKHCIWASWGSYDRRVFEREALNKNLEYPFSSQHINIKALFGAHRSGYGCSVSKALKLLNMSFEGTPHRGIDDSYNIAKLLRRMLEWNANPVADIHRQAATPLTVRDPAEGLKGENITHEPGMEY